MNQRQWRFPIDDGNDGTSGNDNGSANSDASGANLFLLDLAANTPASHAVNLILTLTNAASKTWSSNVNFTVTAADGTYAITGVFGRQASLLITAAKANYL